VSIFFLKVSKSDGNEYGKHRVSAQVDTVGSTPSSRNIIEGEIYHFHNHVEE
jgi:hypothetical protein